jgi:hypothetical protein
LAPDILWLVGRYAFLGLLYLFVLLVLRALVAEMRCEARLAPAAPPVPAVRPAEPAPSPAPAAPARPVDEALRESLPPRLVVVQSADPARLPVGTAFPLTAVTTIGRGEHSSVALRGDQYASTNHALVFMRDGVIHLRDRGSTNGTYVNGARLEDEIALQDGDRVAIGTTEFRFTA